MNVLERTEERLRIEAERRRLVPGAKVRVEWRRKDANTAEKVVKRHRGHVLALYPHMFMVHICNHVECFRYNEMLGMEPVKVRVV